MNTTSSNVAADPVQVALRAWAVPELNETPRPKRARTKPKRTSEPSPITLVFDCETTTDPSQRLIFGVWRLYIDQPFRQPGRRCDSEGIFYADDLPETDPEGFATLKTFAQSARAATASGLGKKVDFKSRSEFVDKILYRVGYEQKATIVGFNLPFDLARLANKAAPARGRNRGGISLRLWDHNGKEHPYRPRIACLNIDSGRTMMSFTTTKDTTNRYRGKFVDVRTLAFAHSDRSGLSLERACALFGVPYVKRDVEHGTITDHYIEYCREDVAATANLYRVVHAQHRMHPIELAAPNTFSAAGIAKSYSKAMGIQPTIERLAGYPHDQQGHAMAAYFGGRSETRIRNTNVPIVLVDFRSMYMTVNALIGTWALLTAEHIHSVDITREVHAMINDPDLAERCFDPQFWTYMHTMVQIIPNGAVLPVRAHYDPHSPAPTVGVNPYHCNEPAWYCLADVIAAVILAPDTKPIVVQAFQTVPEGRSSTLRAVKLLGQLDFNPAKHDLFTTLVEQRHLARTDKNLPEAERGRLDQFLKLLANTGYGIYAEFQLTRRNDPTRVDVYTNNDHFTTEMNTIETPGPYTFAPYAAAITSSARLALALLEHEVTSRGGNYVFCDTDSMAIVANRKGTPIKCPTINGNTIQALTWNDVDQIITKFETLNPYNPKIITGSILRKEPENFNQRKQQHEIRCYAISTKRYQLTTRNGTIIKTSRHGLGQYANPTNDPDRNWIHEAWNHITTRTEYDWLDLPALSKITVNTPEMLACFKHHNNDKPYRDQIKPANFLLLAYTDPLGPNPNTQPITAYNGNPHQWHTFQWLDRTTAQPINVTTRRADGTHTHQTTRLRTYRDILTQYRTHPEHKSLPTTPNTDPRQTSGLLRRRPIQPIPPTRYIGKEANNLDQRATGLKTHHDTNLTYHHPHDNTWTQLTRPALKTIPTKTIAEHTGIPQRTIQRGINGHNTPEPKTLRTLAEFAINHARKQCPQMHDEPDHATLHTYLATMNSNQ